MKRSLIALAVMLSLGAAPAVAQTSASKLSVASAARASARADGEQLSGRTWLIGLAVVAVAVAAYLIIDDNDNSASA